MGGRYKKKGGGDSRGRERDIPVPDWENEKVATLDERDILQPLKDES